MKIYVIANVLSVSCDRDCDRQIHLTGSNRVKAFNTSQIGNDCNLFTSVYQAGMVCYRKFK